MVMESTAPSTPGINSTSSAKTNSGPPVATSAHDTTSSGHNTTGGNNHQQIPSELNPHTLGREFVRQYYTVLNKGPHILHRFYSEDSSLIHGALNKVGETVEPVYGQSDINARIMSLEFKDCHAKIRQVDSLETLDKGVVVQVSGELSNNGQPMRRFFQTFVLAPRSPTNYYVRNDIFRYQDEIFTDDEDASDADAANPSEVTEDTPTGPKQEAVSSESRRHEEEQDAPQPMTTTGINGDAHASSSGEEEVQIPEASPSKDQVNSDESRPVNAASAETSSSPATESKEEVRVATPPPVKTTWARVAGDKIPSSNPFITVPMPGVPIVTPPNQQPLISSKGAASEGNNAVTQGASLPKNQEGQKPQREKRVRQKGKGGSAEKDQVPSGHEDDSFAENTDAVNSNSSSGGMNSKKGSLSYGDEMQVFVGNLPQDISEEELKKFFSKYGSIADVRINRTNQKSAGRTPNYGFVTFDDPKIVKTILSQKPIYFNEHRFNVEEKRSQGRAPGGRGSDRPLAPGVGGSRGQNRDNRDGRRDRPSGGGYGQSNLGRRSGGPPGNSGGGNTPFKR